MPQRVCRRSQPAVPATEHAEFLRFPSGLCDDILRLAPRLGSPAICGPAPAAPIALLPLRRRQSGSIRNDTRSRGCLGAREGSHFSFERLGGDRGGFVSFLLVLVIYFGPRTRVLGYVFFGGALAKVAVDELFPDLDGLAGNLGRVGFEFFLSVGFFG